MSSTLKFCILSIGLFVAWPACRKTDIQRQVSIESSKKIENEEKFFNSNRTNDPKEKSIIEFLRRVNNKSDFVQKTIKQIGFPYWNKAIITSSQNTKSRGDSFGSLSIMLVPFVIDSQQVVNATMKIVLTPTDTSFSYLTDRQYKDSISTGLSAKNQSLILMTMNKRVFGNQLYKIIDSSAYNVQGSNVKYVKINSDSLIGQSSLGNLIESDSYAWVTVQICGYEYVPLNSGQLTGCEPGPNCPFYSEQYVCHSIQILAQIINGEPGGGGSAPPGGGGGSGGTGGNTGGGSPPECYPNPDGTETCNSGWIPTGGGGVLEENPCSSIDAFSGATATLQFILIKPTTLQFTPFDPNSNTQPEQYFVVNSINGSNVSGPVQTLPTTGGSIVNSVTPNTIMVVHTHPFGGYPFPSPADFFMLKDFGFNFQMSYVMGYDGTKYVMVVNSYSQLQAFVNANPGAILPSGGFDPNSNLGQQSDLIRSILVAQGYSADEAYERTLALLMKQAGVTLAKSMPGSDTFKKIGLRQKVVNGNLAVTANGTPIFENADCP